MGRVPWAVKWLVGPALAGVMGFYVLAPRLAGKIPPKIGAFLPPSASTRETGGNPADKQPSNDSPNHSDAPAPDVTVGIRPVAVQSAPPTSAPAPTRRRRVRESAPEAEDKPKPVRKRRKRRKVTKPVESKPVEKKPAEPAPAPAEPTGPDPASTPD